MKFSPEAIAIASFTFVVALLLGGWQQVALLVHGLLGTMVPGESRVVTSLLIGGAVTALAGGAAALAHASAAATSAPWARSLGEGTVLVAGLVIVASIVYAIAAIVGGAYPLWGGFTA